jgi:hypothetical protein
LGRRRWFHSTINHLMALTITHTSSSLPLPPEGVQQDTIRKTWVGVPNRG